LRTLEENLTQYAAYHRDRRNIATHFAGIPMIVLAVVIAGAGVAIPVGSMEFTVAAIASVAASLYYLRLEIGRASCRERV